MPRPPQGQSPGRGGGRGGGGSEWNRGAYRHTKRNVIGKCLTTFLTEILINLFSLSYITNKDKLHLRIGAEEVVIKVTVVSPAVTITNHSLMMILRPLLLPRIIGVQQRTLQSWSRSRNRLRVFSTR